MPLKRVLIANRGEIAVRIIRACREEGIEAVTVHSDADREAYHVRMADRSVEIGSAAASDSYLRNDRIIDAAREVGADAVHPGYGFLAERADLVTAVEEAGMTFIGPPAGAISEMGDKTRARSRMREAGVPIVPGTTEPLADADEAVEVATGIGFPVMLKAAAGGGGKGMRVVRDAESVKTSFDQAASEALKAFGDGSVYVEKFVERPRHVEIQVLADNHGNVIHVGERECSVQRRHQKLVEECPSPAVDDGLRDRMGAAAVAAARSVGYTGAGTVEFLLDPSGEFYFLEMNTRIQVEHPITELVYGIDLVRWQLRIAAGEALDIDQTQVVPRGHAIECRIIAEDPDANFAPAPGVVSSLNVPSGPGIRWDGGIESGDRVELFYDPMIAKLIVHADDRDAARARMYRALGELEISGVKTARSLHRRILLDAPFASGEYDIGYLEASLEELLERTLDESIALEVALAAAWAESRLHASEPGGADEAGEPSRWLQAARQAGLR